MSGCIQTHVWGTTGQWASADVQIVARRLSSNAVKVSMHCYSPAVVVSHAAILFRDWVLGAERMRAGSPSETVQEQQGCGQQGC